MLDPGLVVKDGIAGGAEDVGTGGAAGAGAGTETGGAEVVGETPGLIDGAVAAAAALVVVGWIEGPPEERDKG